MIRGERILLTLLLAGLLMPGLNGVARSQASDKKTFTISGNVGLPGVTIRGLPGDWMMGEKGEYRARVPYGWSGVVTPEKEGYRLEPPDRTFDRVTQDLADMDFIPTVRQFTISDVVKVGVEPIQDVTVRANPGGYTAITDTHGRYSLKVPYGWSGYLTMFKPDFDFRGQIEYVNVTADIIDRKSVSASGHWPPLPAGTPQAGVPDSKGDVFVIPTADVMPERIAETTEDLRVMLQILREKLSEPRMILGVLRDYGSFFGDDRKTEALYLQGTAAVFVVKMDFPYSFPTQRPDANEVPQETADPVWQRARQKLYSPGGARNSSPAGQTQAMTFEQFKEELLRSLKHAANLRHIDPNELVILTLVAQNEDTIRTGEADLVKQYANVYGSDYMTMMGIGHPALSTTVLTMQAKKADVDAFAQGALDFDQFRQKVKAFAY